MDALHSWMLIGCNKKRRGYDFIVSPIRLGCNLQLEDFKFRCHNNFDMRKRSVLGLLCILVLSEFKVVRVYWLYLDMEPCRAFNSLLHTGSVMNSCASLGEGHTFTVLLSQFTVVRCPSGPNATKCIGRFCQGEWYVNFKYPTYYEIICFLPVLYTCM